MIGIFDSGSGGLSVYREIVKILPEERYIYFSDNANCPYGTKGADFIKKRSIEITRMLISKGCDVIVVACNTATSAAISTLRHTFSIPIIGMEPAIKQAAKLTQSKVVGVLATAGTLLGEKYHHTRDTYASGVKVVEHIGEGFVELVENGIPDGPEAENTVRKSLEPILNSGADTIVLGCTHYPFLLGLIQKISGTNIRIIDSAPAVAAHLLDVMSDYGLIKKDGPETVLMSSGSPSSLNALFSSL